MELGHNKLVSSMDKDIDYYFLGYVTVYFGRKVPAFRIQDGIAPT
jgi:hypothetical protein